MTGDRLTRALMKLNSRLAVGAMAIALGLPAFAQGPGFGPGYGYGPGTMGPGYGYGPGMGFGHGWGYGPGMMRGYQAGILESLDLTDEQRDKILSIQEDMRAKSWSTMGKMRSETFKLQRMLAADSLDANALADQQKKVDELRRELLKAHVESRKQIESVLTPEQKKQLRDLGPWWLSQEPAE